MQQSMLPIQVNVPPHVQHSMLCLPGFGISLRLGTLSSRVDALC